MENRSGLQRSLQRSVAAYKIGKSPKKSSHLADFSAKHESICASIFAEKLGLLAQLLSSMVNF
eukprot:6204201-Pleurochrysis_carterae.AAC.4